MAPDYDRSPIPRYLQVASAIRRRIEEGHWRANEKISTLAALEDEFAVARVTVRQAVELLENEGLLRRVQGKGTFVAGTVEDKRWLRLDLKWQSIVNTIGANTPRFLEVKAPVPPPTIAPAEGTPADSYSYFESVQSRGNQNFSFACVHVAEFIVARAPERFTREPSICVLSTMPELNIKSAHQSFIIGAADTRVASLLRIGIGFPTAEAHLVVTDADDTVIYTGNIVYRGDCVRLDIDLLG
ncbi:GntR family transcriptional regulator [Afifella pfennigii]|uniref:GntR family transcriptional regulator n=1 Tax=Afifella pfennigii TaxID=209897 RepID=UPI00047A5D11|nr:GntR family transcriptional regulator [Afifella pfennigii]